MMEIKELIPILYQKNTFFQVESGDKTQQWTRYKRRSLQEILDAKEYGSLEAFLQRCAKSEGKTQLNVRIVKKNGGGFLPKQVYLVNVTPNEKTTPVDDKSLGTISEIKPITPVVEPKKDEIKTTTKMDNFDEKLKAAEERIELRFLKEKYENLKKDFDKCDAERKEYIEKNLQLTRDIAVKVDQKDIEHQRKLIEVEKNAKPQGLGSVIEEIKAIDPDTLLIGLGTLMPKHPMVVARAKQMENEGRSKSFNSNAIEDAQILDGVKHSDSDTQTYIEEIYHGLVKSPSGKVGMIGSLVGTFIAHDNHLATAYKHFFPKEYAEQMAGNDNGGGGGSTDGTDENEDDDN